MQLLGKETGYFLGPDYDQTPTFKWAVDTLNDIASFCSLSLNTATEVDPNAGENSELVCPYDLDFYQQFYVQVIAKSIWILLCTGGFYYLFVSAIIDGPLIHCLALYLHSLG